MSADGLGVATRQTVFNQQVRAHRPTKLPQGLLKNWLPRLCLWISRSEGHEQADTTRALRLLRARRERPCCRSAAEERDEFAPFHGFAPAPRITD